jgi:hypothetical protein
MRPHSDASPASWKNLESCGNDAGTGPAGIPTSTTALNSHPLSMHIRKLRVLRLARSRTLHHTPPPRSLVDGRAEYNSTVLSNQETCTAALAGNLEKEARSRDPSQATPLSLFPALLPAQSRSVHVPSLRFASLLCSALPWPRKNSCGPSQILALNNTCPTASRPASIISSP